MIGSGIGHLILSGLALGAAYALAALGFVLVLNAAGAVNFAHGEQVMAGGLIAALLAPLLGPPPLLLAVSVIGGALGGGMIGLLARRFSRRDDPSGLYVATIAAGSLIQHSALRLAGAEPRPVPALIDGLGPSLPLMLTAALALGAVWLLLARTRLGRQLRAAAQDPLMARALGLKVGRLALIAFMLGGALAGLAGLLLARPFLATPFDGGHYMLMAYLAVAAGGWGSLPGAALGGVLLGLCETLGAALVGTQAAEILLYVLVLGLLLLRPRGLIAEQAGSRA